MNSDWDEIKRLAADFQKAQLSSSLQRLSERNIVEIVTLLLEKGLLEIIFTNDGKEYLTPDNLRREIEDELFVNGGRINLIELTKILNVDLHKITTIAEQIAEEDSKVSLILGQLVDSDYIVRIASEINERLSQVGEINVSELTIQYDLPSDFLLHQVVENHLGRIIFGKQDSSNPRLLYTQNFISRCKAKIRGALHAITKPTPISAILAQSGIQERMFLSLINEINITGTITSRSASGQYIPHIYTKTQAEWVKNFFKQNGYLEYDSVSGLGVQDPKSFIQKQLGSLGTDSIKYLTKCAVGKNIVDQIESTLEESIATNTYLDVTSDLPSVFTEEDIEQLISLVLTPSKQRLTQLFGTIIFTSKFIDEMLKPVYEMADMNAAKSVESGQYQKYIAEKQIKGPEVDHEVESKSDKREERRKKAAGGKAGGGAQGRETKTKSTKKGIKNKGKEESDSDDENSAPNKRKGKDQSLELITAQDIKKLLKKALEVEGLQELASSICGHYHPQLSKYAQIKAHELYESSLQNSLQNRKQNHATLQDKLNNILNDIRLYEKGLRLFSQSDSQTQLVKYLLKSLGNDVANEIAFNIACESKLSYSGPQLTVDQRNKISLECDQEYKKTLVELNKASVGTSIEEFLIAAENALQASSMILKKIDKKKDRQIILMHKHGLLDQLYNCNDPALVLHLAALVMFTISTQSMLHASGRFVSTILAHLRPVLSDEQNKMLTDFHDLVMKLLTSSEEEKPTELVAELDKLIPLVKDLASNYKRVGVTSAE